jgi:predicted nucleic-acid-binding protein
MRAVDTNVLVRLLARDDPKQVAAAEAFIENGAWVSRLALAEAMWVLEAVYDRSATQIATAVAMLLNHDRLTIDSPEVASGALDAFRRRPTLGFSDCLLVELARHAGHVPLGTFDRNLAKVEGAVKLWRH